MDQLDIYKFKNELELKIDTIGLSSARFQSAIYQADHQRVIVALLTSISVWDLKTKRKIFQQMTNSNSIYSVLENSKHIYILSYNGEITVLDRNSLVLIQKLPSQGGTQARFMQLNQTHLVTCVEITPTGGTVYIYDLNDLQTHPIAIHGHYNNPFLLSNSTIAILKEDPIQKEEKQKAQNKISIDFYSLHAELLSTLDLNYQGEILCATQNKNSIGYLFVDRSYKILDTETMQLRYSGSIEGKGTIFCCSFYEEELLICPKSGQLLRISEFGTKQIALPQPLLSSQPQYLNQFAENGYFIVNEGGLYWALNGEIVLSQEFGVITFCGIQEDEGIIFAGDFCGGISGYDMQTKERVYYCNVLLPIRTLSLIPGEGIVLIGTMDGTIFEWDYKKEQEPKELTHVEGTATVIKIQKKAENHHVMLIATTQGYILQYDRADRLFTLASKFLAHEPQENADKQKFGSLQKYAECWSCTFHPTNCSLIATCSEDQTVHVYSNEKEIKRLLGHQLAVTSVDWKYMNGKCLLASCSDDQTIRIYDSDNDFELLQVISTTFCREWHTLTYMALEESGNMIAVVSQIGYLFLYNLKKQTFVFAAKVHMGGIEGICWRKYLTTCSSDNCINIITY